MQIVHFFVILSYFWSGLVFDLAVFCFHFGSFIHVQLFYRCGSRFIIQMQFLFYTSFRLYDISRFNVSGF